MFYCELQVIRTRPEWDLGELGLELQSIYVRDNANNLLVVSDQETLKEKAGEGPIRFEFVDRLEKPPPRIENQNINRQRAKEPPSDVSVPKKVSPGPGETTG
jgi:hypothetical protein